MFDGSSDASITSAAKLLVVLNGVLQKPNSGTFSGSEEGYYLNDTHGIKFCDPPASGSTLFVTQLGTATTVNVPADGSVTAAKIGSGAVTTAKIGADAVDGTKIADDAIDSEHYTNASIDHAHLANDCVDGDNIADDAINSEHYVDASIDHQHLANDCVDGDNIADDAVNSEHYVDASIDHQHLANDCVDGDNLADNAVDSEHYTDGSIDTAHIADDQITLAKMAGGTDGQIITYDASGDPVAVGPGTDGQVLTSTGAGSPPAFEDIPGGGITDADQWRLAVSFQGDQDPVTDNWERNDTTGFDKLNTGMSQSSGVWTFPSTGIWWIHSIGKIQNDDMNKWGEFMLYTTINNGTTWEKQSEPGGAVPDFGANAYTQAISDFLFDVTNTTNCKVRFAINQNDTGAYLVGHTSYNTTSITFIRLADT